ncbi:MAG: matrixin family metalloprotease [Actinomycetota bacterium]|nr:matrixin family metalloprotease [Actinomycetota bacterium]
MVEGVRDGDSRDPWDELDLGTWVGAGRPEASADERVTRAARIAGDHARLDWGAIGGPLVPVPRPRRQRGRVTTTALLGLVTAACAVVWVTSPPGEPLGRPATAPAGQGGYAFLDERPDGSGRPVTFDPCKPIHYVVRPDGQPPSGPAAVVAALAEVSRATGLVFVDDGPTQEAPTADRHLTGRWSLRATPTPVLIAWATEDEWPSLAGSVVGEAGPVSQTLAGSTPRFVTGQVVLDAADLAHPPGDAIAAEQVRLVALHEVGHLVGLGHVDDRTQLMHAETGPGLTGFGAGDLRGLHELGSGECV